MQLLSLCSYFLLLMVGISRLGVGLILLLISSSEMLMLVLVVNNLV